MRTPGKTTAGQERRRSSLMFIGMLTALAITLVAFEWTTFPHGPREMAHLDLDFLEEEMIPPSPIPPPPPPPPPAPTTVFEIIDNKEVIDSDVIEVETRELPVTAPDDVGEPLRPRDEIVDEETIFRSVEQMPVYPGCEHMASEEERIRCSEEKLFGFLRKNIKYPHISQETGLSGIVYITYVVDRNGKITDVQVLKGVGGGLDEEAVRVVGSLPDWIPGKQRGNPVHVRYTLPVRFTLR